MMSISVTTLLGQIRCQLANQWDVRRKEEKGVGTAELLHGG